MVVHQYSIISQCAPLSSKNSHNISRNPNTFTRFPWRPHSTRAIHMHTANYYLISVLTDHFQHSPVSTECGQPIPSRTSVDVTKALFCHRRFIFRFKIREWCSMDALFLKGRAGGQPRADFYLEVV